LILEELSSANAESEDEAELDAEIVGEALPEDPGSLPEGEEKPKRKKKSTKRKDKIQIFKDASKKELLDAEQLISRRYVNLVDVFPPIPEKGMFNIEITKDSPYFFS